MSCKRCSLYRTARTVCVPSRGSEHPLVLFVGEAPGKNEDKDGVPFVGRAGEKLDELLAKAGLHPSYCRWSNIVRCIPWRDSPGGKVRAPSDDEIDGCCTYLEKEILATKPALIVPLGASSTYYFLGEKKISKLRGRRHVVMLPTLRYRYTRMLDVLRVRGVQHELGGATKDSARAQAISRAVAKLGYKDVPQHTCTVFPTYHPAAVLYGSPYAEGDILADLNYICTYLHGAQETGDYRTLTSLAEVEQELGKLKDDFLAGKIPHVSCDIESSSLNAFDPREIITLIGFSGYEGTGFSVPYQHRESPFVGDRLALAAVRRLINSFFEVVPLIGHNFKFDTNWLVTRGMRPRIIADDTELAAWTLFNDQSEHDLETLTSRYTDLVLHKQEMKEAMDALPPEERYNTNNYSIDLVGRYCAKDCDGGLRLQKVFARMMREQGLADAHYKIAVPAVIPVATMELNGCIIDRGLHASLEVSLAAELEGYRDALRRLGLSEVVENLFNDGKKGKRREFNLNSAEQKSLLLYDVLGLEPQKFGKVRKTGRLKGQRLPSADKKAILELMESSKEQMDIFAYNPDSSEFQMWKLRFEVLRIVQDYSAASKTYSSYVKNLPKHMGDDGYVHPKFGIRHTATGRFQCVEPPLQTIPWHSVIKQMFPSRFENGVMISADFSQMELRVFAMATKDPELMRTFNEGRDIHTMIASRVLGVPEDEVPPTERRRIKTVNFGMLYGRGPSSIAMQEGISVDKAKGLISQVFEQFPNIKKFILDTHKFVRANGYVRYINGFRRLIPPDTDDSGAADRQAVNSKIQGPASDLGVSALINAEAARKRLRLNAKLYQFVHDSVGYDTPPGELFELCVLLRKEMEDRLPRQFSFINVPLRVDFEVGITWGHLLGMKLLGGRRVEVSGKTEHFELLMERLLSWEDAPLLVSSEEFTKEEPKVVRSLLRTSELEEMVTVSYITCVLEFPPFVRRTPTILRGQEFESALYSLGEPFSEL